MEKTFKATINMWSLVATEGLVLHRIGSDDYSRMATVKPEDIDLYEEVALADVPPYTKAEYDAKVAEMVRRRYSASEEFAIQRKVINSLLSPMTLSADTAEKTMAEYADYNNYVQQCKADAPAAIAEDKTRQEAALREENADFTNAEDERPE